MKSIWKLGWSTMAVLHWEELLILTKTYPNPSTKYLETSCVAAVNSNGEMRRLYPIPFRFLDGDARFQKWEWIRAQISTARSDHRPESHNIERDSIVRLNKKIKTGNGWAERLQWVKPHLFDRFSDLETRRLKTGETLGFLQVSSLINLEITPEKNPDWTDEERVKLTQDSQEAMFYNKDGQKHEMLHKLPFEFHYTYECSSTHGVEQYRHMLTDWEVGALYWNCVRSHGKDWQVPFRQKYETEFAQKDLIFLMGTMHRFPKQWLIIGLVYPPKSPIVQSTGQLSMDLQ